MYRFFYKKLLDENYKIFKSVFLGYFGNGSIDNVDIFIVHVSGHYATFFICTLFSKNVPFFL